MKELDISFDQVFIDGTKIEADANKYKFVFKPTTYHIRLTSKVKQLIKTIDSKYPIPDSDILPSSYIAEFLTVFGNVMDKTNKVQAKQYSQLIDYLAKALEYEEKEAICGEERHSYYKTDHDATAMTLKSDYYSGLGSNMRAAYNLQIAVNKWLIIQYYVSQNRNDIKDFIPLVDKVKESYGVYPSNICADSGYGSFENYQYMKNHDIGNYVKHQSWEGNVSGKNPSQYRINRDNTITCLNHKIGIQVDRKNRHPKNQGAVFYRVEGCNSCPFMEYCKKWQNKKDEDFKYFEVVVAYAHLRKEAENNLLSPEGIIMRVNRSSQVEGAFGAIKYDMNYNRLRRTTIEKVETELMLVILGYNLRKLFRHYQGKKELKMWTPKEVIAPEEFRKPSAKRLTNKVRKKASKSKNQEARDKYKYKKQHKKKV